MNAGQFDATSGGALLAMLNQSTEVMPLAVQRGDADSRSVNEVVLELTA